jgi:hypothetical protein
VPIFIRPSHAPQHHNQEEIVANLEKMKLDEEAIAFGHLSITGAQLNNTSQLYTGFLGAQHFLNFKVFKSTLPTGKNSFCVPHVFIAPPLFSEFLIALFSQKFFFREYFRAISINIKPSEKNKT